MVGYEILTRTRVYLCNCHPDIIIAAICCGTKPNQNTIAEVEAEVEKLNDDTNKKIVRTIKSVVEACWKFEPTDRPTMSEGYLLIWLN